MGLYIRGNHYYFKKQIDGKVYYKALKIKKGQEAMLSDRIKQAENEVTAQHFGLPWKEKEQIGFIDYSKKYLQSKEYKKSWDRDKQRLTKIAELWRNIPLNIVGKVHIERLEKNLFSKNLKHSTVNRYFELVRSLFNAAIDDGYIKENPAKFYKPFVEEGVRRSLNRDELKRILETARNIQSRPSSKLQAVIYDLVVFALNTGMRLSEILNLKRSYIQEDVIFYPVSETKYRRRTRSKTIKVKVICMNSFALTIVNKQGRADDFVFSIKSRSPKTIYCVIKKIRKESGVKDFTFHQLRHTVSTFLSSQVSLATAKTMLGHSDIKTTLKYIHPEIEEQKIGVAKIGEYFESIRGNE